MRFGSVCSGIEAASVAWEHLGWEAAWLSEIEPFPCAVLSHHYPHVSNLGDMTKIKERIASGEIEAPDVFVGGTPCQAFSVAGLRGGLDDPRGGLTLEFVKIADAIDEKRREYGREPSIIVWENVPGVLSSKDNAFGCFLGALAGEECELVPSGKKWTRAGCVYGDKRTVAWRILDAQYFGVAQRRKRVFVVASAGRVDPSQILFEFDGVRRDTPPSREAGEGFAGVAGTLAASGGWMSRPAGNCNETDFLVPFTSSSFGGYKYGFGTIRANGGDNGGGSESLVANVIMDQGGSVMTFEKELVGTLRRETHGHNPIVAFSCKDYGNDATQELSPCMRSMNHSGSHQNGGGQIAVASQMQVRRLTPTECERLQGFPDGYTQIPWRKKPKEECPDGNRYKALGNSMAVPVMAWIGERIAGAIS